MEARAARRDGRDAEITALIIEHLPRVARVVARVARRFSLSIDRDELAQAGVLGLIDAARRFDPTLGCGFAVYSEIRIRGAVLDQLRALDWIPRSIRRDERALDLGVRAEEQRAGGQASPVAVAAALGLAPSAAQRCSVELVDEDALARAAASEGRSPLDALCAARTRHSIEQAIAALPESERGVVSLLYWTDLPLEEAARVLRLDPSRVRLLHGRALQRLRIRLREHYE